MGRKLQPGKNGVQKADFEAAVVRVVIKWNAPNGCLKNKELPYIAGGK